MEEIFFVNFNNANGIILWICNVNLFLLLMVSLFILKEY